VKKSQLARVHRSGRSVLLRRSKSLFSVSLCLTPVGKPNQPCVFCGATCTGQGEHTETKGLLRLWSHDVNFVLDGQLARRKGGAEYREDRIRPTLLDICPACNSWLNVMFEKPGQDFVKKVFTEVITHLRGPEVVAFARWWVKTLFLRSHPAARSTSDAKIRVPGQPDRPLETVRWDTADPQLWVTFRRLQAFPDDLSLWMAIEDSRVVGASLKLDQPRIFLPTIIDRAGTRTPTQLCDIAFAVPPGRILRFHLAFHPHCDLVHPFETAGLATRLWPTVPAVLDLAAHPVLDAKGVEEWKHLFAVADADTVTIPAGKRLPLGPGHRLAFPFGIPVP
jgi:hypothetical protein